MSQSARERLSNTTRSDTVQAREVSLDRRQQKGCIGTVLADEGVAFYVEEVLSSPPQCRGADRYNILEQSGYVGGKLNMESHLGDGSRFTLIALLQYTLHAAKEPHNGRENTTR